MTGLEMHTLIFLVLVLMVLSGMSVIVMAAGWRSRLILLLPAWEGVVR